MSHDPKECSVPGCNVRPAFYRVGDRGFCQFHRAEAVALQRKQSSNVVFYFTEYSGLPSGAALGLQRIA